MGDIQAAFSLAANLILSGDKDLFEIVGLSQSVSMTSVAVAYAIGMTAGAAIAVTRFPGRGMIVVLLNALMGLPPVVVGLGVYLVLSRAGPLGVLGLLYTPTAMIIAQAILVTPVVAALTRQVVEDLHREYDEALKSLGVRGDRACPDPAVGCTLQPCDRCPCRFRARRC